MNRIQQVISVAICFVLWGCGFGSSLAPTEESTLVSPAPDKFTLVRLSPSDGPLEDLLTAEAHKAQEAKQAPYVEFDADWCKSCRALNASLSNERMIDAFEGTYIIRLDLDEWESQLSGAGFYVSGIPTFYGINAEGKPTEHIITGAAWGADIPENMAPPLKEFFHGSSTN